MAAFSSHDTRLWMFETSGQFADVTLDLAGRSMVAIGFYVDQASGGTMSGLSVALKGEFSMLGSFLVPDAAVEASGIGSYSGGVITLTNFTPPDTKTALLVINNPPPRLRLQPSASTFPSSATGGSWVCAAYWR